MQPLSLFVSDEGMNGLHLHAVNETDTLRESRVAVALYRGELVVAQASLEVPLPSRGTVELDVEGILGRFADVGYAYRFGPPGHDLVAASLLDARSGERLAEAFHLPLGLPSTQTEEIGLSATVTPEADGSLIATLRTRKFAQSVAFSGDVRAEDNYFHLAPGASRAVRLRLTETAMPRVGLRALNCLTSMKLQLPEPAEAPR
jgi:beta-mannosidase